MVVNDGSGATAAKPLRPVACKQFGMREFNERVILQAIRLHGSVTKVELVRLTNLSMQTVAVIIHRLLEQQLVLQLEPLLGQPSKPLALNPDGAFFIGIQIGRRKLDVMLIDFAGQPRLRASVSYATPDVDAVFSEIAAQLRGVEKFLGLAKAGRLSGIGIASPLMLGGWQQLLHMPPTDANAWTRTNVRERLQEISPLPVEFAKDTAAACVAELVAGRGRSMKSYLYIFIDTLIGGGLIINRQPHSGIYGNAGAVGTMPLALAAQDAPAGPRQLLDVASLIVLEGRFSVAQLDQSAAGDERALQSPWAALAQAWAVEAAGAIALSVCNAASLLDLDGVIIDGTMHPALLDMLLDEVRTALSRYNWQGVMRPELHAGIVGIHAKVHGAAYLPLHAHFAPANDLFLKLWRN